MRKLACMPAVAPWPSEAAEAAAATAPTTSGTQRECGPAKDSPVGESCRPQSGKSDGVN